MNQRCSPPLGSFSNISLLQPRFPRPSSARTLSWTCCSCCSHLASAQVSPPHLSTSCLCLRPPAYIVYVSVAHRSPHGFFMAVLFLLHHLVCVHKSLGTGAMPCSDIALCLTEGVPREAPRASWLRMWALELHCYARVQQSRAVECLPKFMSTRNLSTWPYLEIGPLEV